MKWTSCEALEGCGVSVSVPCVGVGLRAIYCVDLTRVADTIDLSEDSHCGNYYLTPIPLESFTFIMFRYFRVAVLAVVERQRSVLSGPRRKTPTARLVLAGYGTGEAPIPTFPQRGKGPCGRRNKVHSVGCVVTISRMK